MKNYHIKVYSDGKQILSKREAKYENKHEKGSEYKITFKKKRVRNK